MPKRPRQHMIEDLARASLHQVFASAGWTVEDLTKDYGEDLLVRIFDEGNATPWSFFVQSKGTDRIGRLLNKKQSRISLAVERAHVEHWCQFPQPVVLTLFDTNSGQTYWQVIQTFIESHPEILATASSSATIRIPMSNRLDAEGLSRLKNRTKRQFDLLEAHQKGAQILIDVLKSELGLEISYNAVNGILMYSRGHFVPDPEGGSAVVTFGPAARSLKDVGEFFGETDAEKVLNGSIEWFAKVVEAYQTGGTMVITDPQGNVVKEWKTLEELLEYVKEHQLDGTLPGS